MATSNKDMASLLRDFLSIGRDEQWLKAKGFSEQLIQVVIQEEAAKRKAKLDAEAKARVDAEEAFAKTRAEAQAAASAADKKTKKEEPFSILTYMTDWFGKTEKGPVPTKPKTDTGHKTETENKEQAELQHKEETYFEKHSRHMRTLCKLLQTEIPKAAAEAKATASAKEESKARAEAKAVETTISLSTLINLFAKSEFSKYSETTDVLLALLSPSLLGDMDSPPSSPELISLPKAKFGAAQAKDAAPQRTQDNYQLSDKELSERLQAWIKFFTASKIDAVIAALNEQLKQEEEVYTSSNHTSPSDSPDFTPLVSPSVSPMTGPLSEPPSSFTTIHLEGKNSDTVLVHHVDLFKRLLSVIAEDKPTCPEPDNLSSFLQKFQSVFLGFTKARM